MKKFNKFFAIFGAFAIILSSCSRVEGTITPSKGEMRSLEVRVSRPDSQTKSHVGAETQEGTYPLYWDQTGESIMVHEYIQTMPDSAPARNTVSKSSDYTVSADGKTASFRGIEFEDAGEGSSGYQYVVVTPADSIYNVHGGGAIVCLPEVQRPLKSSYDPKVGIQVGTYGNFDSPRPDVLDVTLVPQMAYARMTVSGLDLGEEKVQTIVFSADTIIYAREAYFYWYMANSPQAYNYKMKFVSMDLLHLNISGSGDFDVFFNLLPTSLDSGQSFYVTVFTESKIYRKSWTLSPEKLLAFPKGEMTEFTVNFSDVVGESLVPPADEIWYTTTNNNILSTQLYESMETDQSQVSHTYNGGLGVVKYAGAITEIKDDFLGSFSEVNVNNIYLPDGVTRIGESFMFNSEITSFRVPESLEEVGAGSFISYNLQEFTGGDGQVAADGRAIVIDGKMVAFARGGVDSFTIPGGVTALGADLFYDSPELKYLNLGSNITYIGDYAFSKCPALEEIVIPSSLNVIGQSLFSDTDNIVRFSGNSPYVTSDNRCFIWPNVRGGGNDILKFAGGGGIQEYTIPSGHDIILLNANSFHSTTLKRLTLIEGLSINSAALTGLTSLEGIYGPDTSSDHRAIVKGDKLVSLVVAQGLNEYRVPDDITKIGYMAFNGLKGLKRVTMGDQVTSIAGYTFFGCPDLEEVVLSANIKSVESDGGMSVYPFTRCNKLTKIYFRSPVPPSYVPDAINPDEGINPDLKMYVPEGSVNIYANDAAWGRYYIYFDEYKYNDLPEFDFYISKDFTSHGEYVELLRATKGYGINILLLGDGFVDTCFTGGESSTYHKYMKDMCDNLFKLEPLKSHKEYFNVKYVKIVSAVNIGDGATSLSTRTMDGLAVAGNDEEVLKYAEIAYQSAHKDNLLAITLMNIKLDGSARGTCWMHDPEIFITQPSSGFAAAYFTLRDDMTEVLVHEAIGHGFAKLNDEYFVENKAISEVAKADIRAKQARGWYQNVSVDNTVESSPWADFVTKDEYVAEGIGFFEGGGSDYGIGVWRPTDTSLMRSTNAGQVFNAPSRYAIYKRIHWLASYQNKNVDDFYRYEYPADIK